jgi:hypothetical protein
VTGFAVSPMAAASRHGGFEHHCQVPPDEDGHSGESTLLVTVLVWQGRWGSSQVARSNAHRAMPYKPARADRTKVRDSERVGFEPRHPL